MKFDGQLLEYQHHTVLLLSDGKIVWFKLSQRADKVGFEVDFVLCSQWVSIGEKHSI